jgi:hypothetical protein
VVLMAHTARRQLIDINEVAVRLNRNVYYVKRLKQRKVLGYYSLDGRIMFDAAEVDALLDAAYVPAVNAL